MFHVWLNHGEYSVNEEYSLSYQKALNWLCEAKLKWPELTLCLEYMEDPCGYEETL